MCSASSSSSASTAQPDTAVQSKIVSFLDVQSWLADQPMVHHVPGMAAHVVRNVDRICISPITLRHPLEIPRAMTR